MPPPLTATLFKAAVAAAAVAAPPPACPFIYVRRRQPPRSAPRAIAPPVIKSRVTHSRRATDIIVLDSPRGAGWWMISGSGRSPPAAAVGLGARRRAGGGAGPVRATGSVQMGLGMNGDHGQQPHPASSSRLLTLPTVLTLGRVAAVPLLVSTFYMNGQWATTATTCIFIAAAITDWLDGYIARKMQLGTAFGAFLDPVADKLMVAATLVLLCTRPLEVAKFGEVPWLLTVPSIAIIGREITMSAVREWAASQNGKVLEAVAVNNLGKWKTATQMTALTILLAMRDPSLTGPGFIVASGVVLLYISSGLALWSLAVYMRNIWRILLK